MLTPKQDQFRIANIATVQGDWSKLRLPEALLPAQAKMQESLGEKVNYLNDEEYTLTLADSVWEQYQAQGQALIDGSTMNADTKKNYSTQLKKGQLLLARERGLKAFNILLRAEDLKHIEQPLNFECLSPSLQGTDLYLDRMIEDQSAAHIVKQLKIARFAPVPGSLQILNGKVSVQCFHEKYGQNSVEVDTQKDKNAPFDMKFIDSAGNEKHVPETQLDTEYGDITDSLPDTSQLQAAGAYAAMHPGSESEALKAAQAQMAMGAASAAINQAKRADQLRRLQAAKILADAQMADDKSAALNTMQNVMANKAALQSRARRDQEKMAKSKKRALELQEEAKAYRAAPRVNDQNVPTKKKKNAGKRFVGGIAAGGGILAAGGGGLVGYLTLLT